MNRNIRKSVIAGLGITCVAVGIGLVSLSPASAVEAAPTSTLQSHGTGARAAQPNIQTMINANQSDHDLDMTITSADGGVVHAVVKPHQGWYPEIDVTGKDSILVKDAAGVAFVGSSPTTATGSLATWNEPRALPAPGTRGHTADLTSARHQADGYRDGERAERSPNRRTTRNGETTAGGLERY